MINEVEKQLIQKMKKDGRSLDEVKQVLGEFRKKSSSAPTIATSAGPSLQEQARSIVGGTMNSAAKAPITPAKPQPKDLGTIIGEETMNVTAPLRKTAEIVGKGAVDIGTGLVGAVGNAVTGNPDQGIQDLGKAASGAMSVLTSPVSGMLQADNTPGYVKEPMKGIGDSIVGGFKYLGKLKGLSEEQVNSDDYYKRVVEPAITAISLLPVPKQISGQGIIANTKGAVRSVKNIPAKMAARGGDMPMPPPVTVPGMVGRAEKIVGKKSSEILGTADKSAIQGLKELSTAGWTKGVETFDDLTRNLTTFKDKIIRQRNDLIKTVGENPITKKNVIQPLKDYVTELKDNPAVMPATIKKIEGILQRYETKFKGQTITIEAAEQLKEQAWKAVRTFDDNIRVTAETAIKKIGAGLKNEIERVGDAIGGKTGSKIKNLNQKYGNLTAADEALQKQLDKSQVAVSQEGIEAAIESLPLVGNVYGMVKGKSVNPMMRIESGAVGLEKMLGKKLAIIAKESGIADAGAAKTFLKNIQKYIPALQSSVQESEKNKSKGAKRVETKTKLAPRKIAPRKADLVSRKRDIAGKVKN